MCIHSFIHSFGHSLTHSLAMASSSPPSVDLEQLKRAAYEFECELKVKLEHELSLQTMDQRNAALVKRKMEVDSPWCKWYEAAYIDAHRAVLNGCQLTPDQRVIIGNTLRPATAPKSYSNVITPYAAEARYRNSQHLDNDPRIGKLIPENRHTFEKFVTELGETARANGVPDSPEYTQAIHFIELAKDAMGRALIHAIGQVKGVSFEEAVAASVANSNKRARTDDDSDNTPHAPLD